MVGSVLVYEDRIIGEGYHRLYGQAHAEVNCINSVAEKDKHLVDKATLYVSLEPCAHFGKTPPCSDLIIAKNIPQVVVGCRDPFEQVNGKGIEKLRAAGIQVVLPVMEQACKQLNKRFFTFHTRQRPYIILKWAATADNRIAAPEGSPRLHISNEYTNRLVHRWRSEEAAILIGTNTALYDNPSLTNRLWTGHHPVRLVIDTQLRLPTTLQVFDGQQKTIVFNHTRQGEQHNLHYYQLPNKEQLVQEVLQAAHRLSIQSILVEGGAQLLQSFINDGLWDEARIITNETLVIGKGLAAPVLSGHLHTHTEKIQNDTIRYFTNQNHND